MTIEIILSQLVTYLMYSIKHVIYCQDPLSISSIVSCGFHNALLKPSSNPQASIENVQKYRFYGLAKTL